MTRTVHFLPWLRSGLGLGLTTREPETLAALTGPATLNAHVSLDGTRAEAQVALRPPHLIARIDSAPDLPWLASPHAPDEGGGGNTGRLRPWVVLVCVPTARCTLGSDAQGQTLLADAADLPDLAESWAWAHVQSDVPPADTAAAAEMPDGRVIARLICPRRLLPNTRYRAALVNAWTADGAGLAPAWTGAETGVTLRCFDDWTFTTSDVGSFEELCDRLGPVTGGPSAFGMHPMDMGNAGLPGLWDDLPGPPRADYSGAIASMAASPETDPDVVDTFRKGLRELFDATDGRREAKATGPDPIMTIPFYGRFATGATSVPGSGWMSELNLTPDRRVAAGLGARLVRLHQERLIAVAWDQLGAIAETNRTLGRAVLRREVGTTWKTRALDLDAEQLAGVLRPQTTFLRDDQSVPLRLRVGQSNLPNGALSPAMTRVMRPSGVVRKSLLAPLARGTDPELMQLRRQWKGMLSAQLATEESRAALNLDRPRPPDGMRTRSRRKLPSKTPAPRPLSTATLRTVIAADLSPARVTRQQAQLRVPALAAILPADATALPCAIAAGPEYAEALATTLMELSPDLLMPGARTFPANAVGLLKGNPGFAAALLAGANHEMIRELIWREVPTPLSHTCFRRFWARPDPADVDIGPMAEWDSILPLERLGQASGESAIVMIRGDLMRQFPSSRVLLVAPGEAEPMAPAFTGRIPPDMAFFGFDVPDADAVTAADSEWLVILEEPPFEPRFGLDDGGKGARLPSSFSELDWAHLSGQTDDHLRVTPEAKIAGDPTLRAEAHWGLNGAHMARATLQQPFRKIYRAPDLIGGRP